MSTLCCPWCRKAHCHQDYEEQHLKFRNTLLPNISAPDLRNIQNTQNNNHVQKQENTATKWSK